MAVSEVVKQAKDAAGNPINLVFQDKNSDATQLAAIHALRNASGTTINPASDDNLTALAGTAISAAVMPTGGIGTWGWLSAIWKAATSSLLAGENHIGEVAANNFAVAATAFNRPANTTAYASGQLVANSTTAGSVVPIQLSVARKNGGTGRIRRIRLSKSGTSLTNAQFRVHLYKAAPTPANGDGGTWSTSGVLDYVGGFDVTMDKAFTDGAKGIGTPLVGTDVIFDCATGSQVLYALVEARAAYTPVSGETFTVAAEVERN